MPLLMTRNHRRARIVVVLLVRVLRQIRQPEPERLLLVVRANQALAVRADAAEPVAALRPARLHAHARLDARDHVGARGVAAVAARERLGAVGVVAAEVEEVDAREGDEEAADEGEGADHVGGVEAVEEDEGGAEGGRGEGDVVEWVDAGRGWGLAVVEYLGNRSFDVHVGGELAERLVEVVHLRQDADGRDNHKHIGRRVGELVVPAKRQLEGDAKGLDGHDRDGADGRADAQVDERVLLAVPRRHLVDHDAREHADDEGIQQEPYSLVSKPWLLAVSGGSYLAGSHSRGSDQ